MTQAVSPLLVVVVLLNFLAVGTSRMRAVINAAAAQGFVLGLLSIVAHGTPSTWSIVFAVGATLIKGIAFPVMLGRAMRDVAIRREVEPLLGYVPSLLLCALATALSLLFSSTLPLAPGQEHSLLLPVSLSTVLTGFLLLTTRRKAITQVVGYLLLENGIFILGLGLSEAMPFLVEIGVLLDLFVGIFVMGIMIHQINREFSSLDTARLSTLRE